MFTSSMMNDCRVIGSSPDSFSTADLLVTCTTLSFNFNAASELHYPSRVLLIASDDGVHLAIKGWTEDSGIGEEHTLPFFDRSVKPSPKRIIIRNKKCAGALRRARGWDSDKERRKAFGLYSPKDDLIYFDLSKAFFPSEKTAKKKRELSLSDYPKLSDISRLSHTMKPWLLALPSSPDPNLGYMDAEYEIF